MKITRLSITNFRGVAEATFHFDGHTLFVGPNNVGKSTVCEALDLVLGPDRLFQQPPVDEYDFYNSTYIESDGSTPRPLRIEVVLTKLSEELKNRCRNHIEFWHSRDKRLLAEGEVSQVDGQPVEECLRLETVAQYSFEEDDFEAQTFYSHSPLEAEGELKWVSKTIKRLIGFIYLRTLRTGSRALSLERGSLLDTILQLGEVRTGLWEESIKRLRELSPPIDHGAVKLQPVLESIEKRLAQYIPTGSSGSATKLHVSQLTREHLRKTMAFFLTMTSDQKPVPFQEVGTGTLNTLVLALLSFIAELREDNVIFAMEEPEIALPPHTQRRIVEYLLTKTQQCFVTSHSPYIIEKFEPDQIQILRRSVQAHLSGSPIILDGAIKPKTYRKHARRGLCEAMLGRAVVVVEGLTEQIALWAVAAKLEEECRYYPLDLSGITIFAVDGDGALPAFGTFFKNLGLKTYAFYDLKTTRKAEEKEKIRLAFDLPLETAYSGAEKLLTTETPPSRQWQLLTEIREIDPPLPMPPEDEVRSQCLELLKGRKGDGTAGRLVELCDTNELPATMVSFLTSIYSDFPRPAPVPVASPTVESSTAAVPRAPTQEIQS